MFTNCPKHKATSTSTVYSIKELEPPLADSSYLNQFGLTTCIVIYRPKSEFDRTLYHCSLSGGPLATLDGCLDCSVIDSLLRENP